MMEQERALFQARSAGLQTQLRALDELRSFLEREIESLQKQLGFLDQQIDSVREELESVTTLVDQGLAVAPRQLALERSLLQVQSDRLAAETGLLRARQEASRTELSILELRNRHASEVASELRDTEMQLSEIQRKTDTALMLLHDSETTGPRLAAMRADAARAEPVFTIVRPVEAGSIELAAGETTKVQPGDTLKVELPMPTEIHRTVTGESGLVPERQPVAGEVTSAPGG
jgi:polysaccharide export outer membrane protein/exopolysaccharide production protein ExoF